MEACPPIWKLRAYGAVLGMLGTLTLALLLPAVVLLVLLAALAVEQPGAALAGACALTPFAAIWALFMVAALAELLVGLRVLRGDLRDVTWAADAADFLRHYSVWVAVGSGLLAMLVLAALGADAAGVVAAPLVATSYMVAQRRIHQFLRGLRPYRDWWEWTEDRLAMSALGDLG